VFLIIAGIGGLFYAGEQFLDERGGRWLGRLIEHRWEIE
jgi:hypothetical protein